MKRISLLMMLFVTLGTAVSCSDDDNDSTNEPITNEETAAIATAMREGVWQITAFTKDGVERTTGFEGYNFVFDGENDLIATNGTTVNTGTWSVTLNNEEDENDFDFIINYSSPANFQDLKGNYDIVTSNDVMIQLIELNNGNDAKYLTFERN